MRMLLDRRFITILLFVSIIMTIVTGFCAYHKYQRAMQVNNDIIQSYQTLRAANQSLLSINEAAMNVSNYILTNNADTLTKIPQLILSAQINAAVLNQLIQDTPAQIDLSNQLKPLFNEKLNS